MKTAIDVHPSMLPCIRSGDEAQVQALTRVSNAVSVEVEPLGVSEWEMIDCFSEYLRQGGFLNQISLVFPNQIVPLRLPTRDAVRVKILPRGFENEGCLRVVRDTLLVVGPKPRTDEANAPSGPLRLVPVFPDDIPASIRTEYEASPLPRSPPPFTVCIHPETLDKDIPGHSNAPALGLVWLHSDESDNLNMALVRILPSDDVPRCHAGTIYTSCL